MLKELCVKMVERAKALGLKGKNQTSTEKQEYEKIYEEIKERQRAYAAAHPGRYYLLNEYEMDDIASYHQIKTLDRAAKRYQERKKAGKLPPAPSVPKQSLIQACLDLGWIDARPEWQRQGLPQPPAEEE